MSSVEVDKMPNDMAEVAKPSQLHLLLRMTPVMDGRRVSFRTNRNFAVLSDVCSIYREICLAFEMGSFCFIDHPGLLHSSSL